MRDLLGGQILPYQLARDVETETSNVTKSYPLAVLASKVDQSACASLTLKLVIDDSAKGKDATADYRSVVLVKELVRASHCCVSTLSKQGSRMMSLERIVQ